MSFGDVFQVSIPVEGKEVVVVFQEGPLSDTSIQIGGKSYTYSCVEDQEKIRGIVEKSLQSAPGNIQGFKERVLECAQSPALAPVFRKALSPASPAEKAFGQLMDAINSGDFQSCMAIEQDEENARGDVRFYHMTGGLEIVQVLDTSASHVKCLVKEKQSDQFWHFTFTISPEGQIKFQGLPVSPPEGFVVERMTETELFQALNHKLEELTAQGLFSGTVLIADKKGTPLYTFVGSNLPDCAFNLDTKFNLGSMNKMFTAVAIMQLIQEGVFTLDTPIGEILKNHPDLAHIQIHPKVAEITIRQLLTHTGGVGDIFDPEAKAIEEDLKTPKDYIALYNARGLVTPAREYNYSNYGFVLLGAAIEAMSGQDYDTHIQEKIYVPAGMQATACYPKNALPANTASGLTRNYEVNACPLIKNDAYLPMKGMPFGGGYSTVKDLSSFATALTSHKFLDDYHTDLLVSLAIPDGGGGLYSYGFQVSQESPRWFGHAGRFEGVNSNLHIYPDSGYVVVVMANLDVPSADRVINFIDTRLPVPG